MEDPSPAVLSTGAYDVIVVGAGAAGLTAGIALAQAGLRVAVLGPLDARAPGRTVALLDGSVRLCRSLGLWDRLSAAAEPLETIRIIDDTGSLFRPPPIAFRASEIGLEAFGYNIENEALVAGLAAAAAIVPGLDRVDALATRFDFGGDTAVVLAGGRRFEAPLIAAADGRSSPARTAAGIAMRRSTRRQSAITAVLAHRLPHRNASTEFHTRGGPFTLVPLPGKAGVPHRSSLVWMMTSADAEWRSRLDDVALAAEIERRAQSMLGAMRLEGPRGLFPIVSLTAERLTGTRLVLLGEAAHVFPPIGAQGLNLGLRDVAHLVELLSRARMRRHDLGGPELLAGFEAARRADVMSRNAAVATLNGSLLSRGLAADLIRGVGLVALESIGPLRRALMRAGVMSGGIPARFTQRPARSVRK